MGTLCWRHLRKACFHCLRTESASVVLCCCGVIFFRNSIAFLSIFTQKLKEALVATVLDTCDLEVVPGVGEERLDVGLELRVGLRMLLGTFTANESAKGDVAVAASIVLAVDAVSVELLLGDPLAQIGGHFGPLNVTVHRGLLGRLFLFLLHSSWSACSLLTFFISIAKLLRGQGRRIVIGGNFHHVR